MRLVFLLGVGVRCEGWGPADALAAARESDKAYASSASATRDPRVTATCDTRGNLGPCSVVVQPAPAPSCGPTIYRRVPGSDWLRDRWQAEYVVN